MLLSEFKDIEQLLLFFSVSCRSRCLSWFESVGKLGKRSLIVDHLKVPVQQKRKNILTIKKRTTIIVTMATKTSHYRAALKL